MKYYIGLLDEEIIKLLEARKNNIKTEEKKILKIRAEIQFINGVHIGCE